MYDLTSTSGPRGGRPPGPGSEVRAFCHHDFQGFHEASGKSKIAAHLSSLQLVSVLIRFQILLGVRAAQTSPHWCSYYYDASVFSFLKIPGMQLEQE